MFPSYAVFRDILSRQILEARSRICIVSASFEDRELALMLYGVSRRAVTTAIRVNPRGIRQGGRLEKVVDELVTLGLPVQEVSLASLKLNEPTVIAIDSRTWSVGSPLRQTFSSEVEVEAAPWTSAEVCRWAQAAQSAKPQTVR